jgi:hypothetical protein
MQLINTEGLALVGPGSEWFWTALSGIVLALTAVGIYRQVRLQRDAAAIEQIAALAREWLSEPMARNRVAILTALKDGNDPTKAPPWAIRYIGNFWERIGYLVRSGHMEVRFVHETFADVGIWWRWIAGATGLVRAQTGNWTIGEHFEWLAASMDEMDRKRGIPAPDAARLLPSTLESNLEAIRTAEELRAVVMRPTSMSKGRGQRRTTFADLAPDQAT